MKTYPSDEASNCAFWPLYTLIVPSPGCSKGGSLCGRVINELCDGRWQIHGRIVLIPLLWIANLGPAFTFSEWVQKEAQDPGLSPSTLTSD